MKRKALTLLMLMLLTVASALAVPEGLDCSDFADSETQICTQLDQVGTGIGLMSYKLNLALPSFLLGLAFVSIVLIVIFAIVAVVKRAVAMAAPGGKRFK